MRERGRGRVASLQMALGCALLVLAAVLVWATNAQAATFDARGSVEQVYATGFEPNAQAVLYDGLGQEVETKSDDDLGGVLFREVAPGSGYRVAAGGTKSPALRVLTTKSAPPAPTSTASRSPHAATAT